MKSHKVRLTTTKSLANCFGQLYNAADKKIFKSWYCDAGKIVDRDSVCTFVCSNWNAILPVTAGFFAVGGSDMRQKAQIMDENAVKRALMRLSHEIVEKNRGAQNLVFVGIKRRGKPMANRVSENIFTIEGIRIPCGSIDIKFYRDDLSQVAESPEVKRASLPFDVNGRDVVLFDDVLYTGRTARAAIEAVFSCGRPKTIQLAILVDRGHRELPIRADYVGKNLPTARSELVEVRLPEYDGETGVFLMDTE